MTFLGASSLATASLPTIYQEEPLPNLNSAGFTHDIITMSCMQVPQAHIASIAQPPLAAYPFWKARLANKGGRAVWNTIPRIMRALKGSVLLQGFL